MISLLQFAMSRIAAKCSVVREDVGVYHVIRNDNASILPELKEEPDIVNVGIVNSLLQFLCRIWTHARVRWTP